jgi:hypothetical protein
VTCFRTNQPLLPSINIVGCRCISKECLGSGRKLTGKPSPSTRKSTAGFGGSGCCRTGGLANSASIMRSRSWRSYFCSIEVAFALAIWISFSEALESTLGRCYPSSKLWQCVDIDGMFMVHKRLGEGRKANRNGRRSENWMRAIVGGACRQIGWPI